jgi:hypothetical protein
VGAQDADTRRKYLTTYVTGLQLRAKRNKKNGIGGIHDRKKEKENTTTCHGENPPPTYSPSTLNN